MPRPYRSTLTFLAIMIVGGGLLLSSRVDQGLFAHWTVCLTALAAAVLQVLGFSVHSAGQTIAGPDKSFTMLIGNGCNGGWAHLIFLASVLAYPTNWKDKLVGLVVGQPLLLVLNVIRIASLFVIGTYAPAYFRAAHVQVWQFLIVGFAMLLLFVWVNEVVRKSA